MTQESRSSQLLPAARGINHRVIQRTRPGQRSSCASTTARRCWRTRRARVRRGRARLAAAVHERGERRRLGAAARAGQQLIRALSSDERGIEWIDNPEPCPGRVRCITRWLIPRATGRSWEERDSWVNGLPGGESQTGQEHAVKAGTGGRRLRPCPARPARYGEGRTARTAASSVARTRPRRTTSEAGPPG